MIISVIGAGAWGTALALQLAKNNHLIKLWDIDQSLLAMIAQEQVNQRYLPEITLPANIKPINDLSVALDLSDLILVVVPSQAFQDTLQKIKPLVNVDKLKIICGTKGLTLNQQFLHQAIEEIFGSIPMAIISGPTFAYEVAIGLPTAITVASNQKKFADEVARCFHSPTFRIYTSNDLIGVQIGGAIKNIFAIAVGIADGMGFGANARSALITRSLAEMARFNKAFGGQTKTLMGLAGLGDLILTCTDNQSRNRRLGLALGRNQNINSAQAEINGIIEGIPNTKIIYTIAQQLNIEMPIVEQIYQIIYHQCPPQEAVTILLNRPLKTEEV